MFKPKILAPNKPGVYAFPGTRLLIIEDEEEIQRIYWQIFENTGCTLRHILVAEPPGAQNVINAVRNFKPHIIITGLDQPGMSGEEILKAIRSHVKKHIPSIVISARADVETLKRIFKLRIDEHVMKPFEPEMVLKAVKHTLQPIWSLPATRCFGELWGVLPYAPTKTKHLYPLISLPRPCFLFYNPANL